MATAASCPAISRSPSPRRGRRPGFGTGEAGALSDAGFHQDGRLVIRPCPLYTPRAVGRRHTAGPRGRKHNSYVNCSRGSLNQGGMDGSAAAAGPGGSSSSGPYVGRRGRFRLQQPLRSGCRVVDRPERLRHSAHMDRRQGAEVQRYITEWPAGVRQRLLLPQPAGQRNPHHTREQTGTSLSISTGAAADSAAAAGPEVSSSSVPSWAVGTFSGYYNRYDQMSSCRSTGTAPPLCAHGPTAGNRGPTGHTGVAGVIRQRLVSTSASAAAASHHAGKQPL